MPKWRNLHNSTNFCSCTGAELIQLIFHAHTVGVSLLWLKRPFPSQHIPPYTPISCFTLEHTAQLRSPCHCEIFGFAPTAVKIIFSFSLFTQKLVDGNLCDGKSHLYLCCETADPLGTRCFVNTFTHSSKLSPLPDIKHALCRQQRTPQRKHSAAWLHCREQSIQQPRRLAAGLGSNPGSQRGLL